MPVLINNQPPSVQQQADFAAAMGLASDSDLSSKQDTLVSGTNIKTVNGTSVLGSGNIVISGSGVADGDKGDISVSGNTWTIDNLAVTNAKVATGLDAIKIASGTVSNTEFETLNGVTSSIQSQLDAKLSEALAVDVVATKTIPAAADQLLILDSAATGTPKLMTVSNLLSNVTAQIGNIETILASI